MTVRHVDVAARQITVDIVVHGEHGDSGHLGGEAQPGQPIYLMGPGGAYTPDPAADWHLLAGDESALPAIAAALEALPANAIGKAFIEVAGPEDEIALTAPEGVEVTLGLSRWPGRFGSRGPCRRPRTADRGGHHRPVAAGAGARLHPWRGANRHAQFAALHPKRARRGREIGVFDLWLLAARPHRRDVPAMEERTG